MFWCETSFCVCAIFERPAHLVQCSAACLIGSIWGSKVVFYRQFNKWASGMFLYPEKIKQLAVKEYGGSNIKILTVRCGYLGKSVRWIVKYSAKCLGRVEMTT